jgi:Sec-independent protein translocase protein TatA
MRNISIGQILVLIIICFLLFGDLSSIKKQMKIILKQFNSYFKTKK